MKISIIGAGNSGLAMSAHLSKAGHKVSLWNRSKENIKKLIKTKTIHAIGSIEGRYKVDLVTDDLNQVLINPDLILITIPANSHSDLAQKIASGLKNEPLIVLNPGRTFGALEFNRIFKEFNQEYEPEIAESQTIIYTCRKISEDKVDIISLKTDVLISSLNPANNEKIIERLPKVLQDYFIPAKSMIETSLGNVGMILHCAPLLLNTGWTESKKVSYKYYYDGITPAVSRLIEKIDQERVAVSKKLGLEVESTKEWLERTYELDKGKSLYETIHNNQSYLTIDAPKSMNHRYILEDVPSGLVPLEAIGHSLSVGMETTTLIINLASTLMEKDFRKTGRNLDHFIQDSSEEEIKSIFKRSEPLC